MTEEIKASDIASEEIGGEETAGGKNKRNTNNANQVKTKVNLSHDDFFRAHISLFYRRPTTIMILVLAGVILCDIYFRYNFMRDNTGNFFWIVSVGSVIMAMFGLPFILKLQIRKLYNYNPYWYSNPKFCVDNKGVSITTQKGGVRAAWDEFSIIRENKEFFLFQINRFNIVCIPYRAMVKEERNFVRGLIRKNTEGKKIRVKIKGDE